MQVLNCTDKSDSIVTTYQSTKNSSFPVFGDNGSGTPSSAFTPITAQLPPCTRKPHPLHAHHTMTMHVIMDGC